MEFKDLITKQINLELNDGLSSYNNLACQQNHNVYEVFYDFLKEITSFIIRSPRQCRLLNWSM